MPDQDFLGQITASTETGSALASRMNAFDLAVKSGFLGTTRPSGIATGGMWVKDNGDSTYTAMVYDGASDVPIGSSGILVSGDDTTSGDLETKLIVGTGLSLSTTSPGANEKRQVALNYASQADAETGTATDKPLNALGVAQAIAAQAQGGLVPIVTKTASSDASLDFTELDDTIYDSYVLRLTNLRPASNLVSPQLLVSTDGGSTWENSYSVVGRTTTTPDGDSLLGATGSSTIQMANANRVGTTLGVSGTIDVFGTGDTGRDTSVNFDLSWFQIADIFVFGRGAGFWRSGTDVDALQLKFSSGNINDGSATLYGYLKP